MGFLQAIAELGGLDHKAGLESYLKFPLDNGGKVIRVYLDIEDINTDCLNVTGVSKIDFSDQLTGPGMKTKYLYRDRVGANVTWGFTPLYKLGKPKANREANKKDWIGTSGNWLSDKKCHFNKIHNRVLLDYEKEGVLPNRTSYKIMDQLVGFLDLILDDLVSKESHVILFGANVKDSYLYPGEIPAFVTYFERKLKQSTQSNSHAAQLFCSLCGERTVGTAALSSVFKFATMDKINFLPGLKQERSNKVFAICRPCFERVSAGRERVERTLTSSGIIPGLRLWVIPEGVGPNSQRSARRAVTRIESLWAEDRQLESPGEKAEERLFRKMAMEGNDLVFHFMFWEKNKAQELVHLMVEDVPPERLAFLGRKWDEAVKSVFGNIEKTGNLDWAIKSLYITLNRLAGKSEGDKLVFRDLAIRILGKMLKGEKLPVSTFKQVVVKRSTRLIYETDNWNEVKRSLLYAQIWVEFMNRINRG